MLPELHKFKPQDLGFVVHEDAVNDPNGFISSRLADRLRRAEGGFCDSRFYPVVDDSTPWVDHEPLSCYYHVPNRVFVLILAGPSLLNGKEWFYKIFFEEKTCWFPALKIINVYPTDT